ncbi:hypothetical protein ACFQ71_37595 [Streptomyces sp. NPDC056534]|uniref:hypothetical protein n=1 Tax=Streptomyces sp. NPDC056534 TaxID=3345857 RepID=UPI0036A493FE
MSTAFEVRPRYDLSLADVVAIQAEGGAVLRSAHPGNWSPGNLTVASLGLRCVLTDLTMTGADDIYHPSGIIVGRRFHPGLCRKSRSLVVKTPVRRRTRSRLPGGLEEWFPGGKNLARAHCDALRAAVPAADVTFFSDYLMEDYEFAVRALEIAADAMPQLWRRLHVPGLGVVDAADVAAGKGAFQQIRGMSARPGSWAEIQKTGVLGVTEADHGWLVPVEVMCLLMAVLDGRRFGTSDVYHLGGVRMMHYIAGLLPSLQTMYGAMAEELRLPDEFNFHLVPSANMTLGVPRHDRTALDHLVDVYLSAYGNSDDSGPGQNTRPDRFKDLARLSWAADSCAVPFFDVRDANYCSQYDLLVQEEEWYMSPWALEAPLGEVGRMISAIDRLRNPK